MEVLGSLFGKGRQAAELQTLRGLAAAIDKSQAVIEFDLTGRDSREPTTIS